MIALIPARAGSRRVPGKNTKLLGGVPLIAWTIQAAKESGVFSGVYVSTEVDETRTAEIAWRHDVEVIWRSSNTATDSAPDILWLREALTFLRHRPQAFAILRATSPFRSADTIRRAYAQWQDEKDTIDSLRAVTPSPVNPYKMWVVVPHVAMDPLIPATWPDGTPYHSSPTQTVPTVYVQTGALEMGWTRNVECLGTISGRKISPFLTRGPEALDINTERDWAEAERLLATGQVEPPAVSLAGVSRAPA